MKRSVPFLLSLAMAYLLGGTHARAIDSSQVKVLMSKPPREYATAPLWVWNDMLTEEQVLGTLRDLAGQNVKQVFVHPRPGLMTPYLSEEWFKLWKAVLAEAERLDMNVWIYDENSYPSGFAGGWVPELMPESRGRGLVLKEYKEGETVPKELVGIYRVTGGTDSILTRPSTDKPEAGDLLAVVQRAGNSPWHGNRCYVDLLYPGVTEKFLEVTLEPYRKHFGEQFGKRIPGSFTDEPEIRPAGGLPWTPDLPEVFQKRWGYSLVENIPSLFREVGDWKRVRHNYYQTLNDLFVERWAKPYHDYCEKNKLEFTGHYWEHSWPICTQVPDNMAMYAWHQRPAIDVLMNHYREDVHAQFGNARAVRELASVANQLGRSRTLCEAYGAGGWDLRFEDMKRIGDWLYVLGVNTMNEHLSFVTIRGARKYDHPQSFSYHEPWWTDYHVMADYWARLSAVMSQGEQINKVLLLQPTTTAWMYNNEQANHKRLGEIGAAFQKMVLDFEAAQVEYDIGSEDIITRHGSVEGKALKVGKRSYTKVVLPPLTENLNAKTLELLETYSRNGGALINLGELTLADGRPSDRARQLARTESLPNLAVSLREDGLSITRAQGDKGILFHHRRHIDDGQILFLVNTSIDHPSAGTLECVAGGIERWDLWTGKTEAYPFTAGSDNTVRAEFQLPPCGSLLLFLSKKPLEPAKAVVEKITEIPPVSGVQAQPVEPNVLVLDYMDVTAGGETKKDVYRFQAQQFVFQKNGLSRNPWNTAVQFKDELISKKFPEDSGFEASYKFTIAEKPPAPLFIVIERPDLYTILCNGQEVTAAEGQWWLDKAFGKIDISRAVKSGENVVTIKARPFTIYHELEPAYVLGDFALKPAEKGFVILPSQPLKLGPWNEQGRPFYAAGVRYIQTFDVPAPTAGRYRVSLAPSGADSTGQAPERHWYGSVARVTVNGKDVGHIFHAPWECDVTSAIQPGENVVEVTVVGTLKNTLGPHHGNPPLGIASPNMFYQGPEDGPPTGSQYSTVGYGLFKPFALRQTK